LLLDIIIQTDPTLTSISAESMQTETDMVPTAEADNKKKSQEKQEHRDGTDS
jgi:hypothetical protein